MTMSEQDKIKRQLQIARGIRRSLQLQQYARYGMQFSAAWIIIGPIVLIAGNAKAHVILGAIVIGVTMACIAIMLFYAGRLMQRWYKRELRK